MPLLVFFKSDRLFFCLNVISFLLMPGLTFRVMRGLGVRGRVAWHWMWLVPTGYCFILQAGGGASDLFAVPYVLAALAYAFAARRTKSIGDVALSMLAAALMTSVRPSNMTLLLPWAVAIFPLWRVAIRRPFLLIAVTIVASGVSFLPTALLNIKFCGDWSGVVLEPYTSTATPPVAVVGNSVLLAIQNLTPAVFPWAKWFTDNLSRFMPHGLYLMLDKSFERGWQRFAEIPVEDVAALGFGVSGLVIVSLIWVIKEGWKSFRLKTAPRFRETQRTWYQISLMYAPWGSLLAHMARMNLYACGRHLTPTYPLLFGLLLSSSHHERLVRRRWWQMCALGVFALAFLVLVLNPARPLWPADTVLEVLETRMGAMPALQRARVVYHTYGQRHDALAPIRDQIPVSADRVGVVTTGDELEASLWKPYGTRKIVHVLPLDTASSVRLVGCRYVVISPFGLHEKFKMSLQDWLHKYGAEIVATARLAHYASRPPTEWYLAKLR